MKIEITLQKYLELGGRIEEINWEDAHCDSGGGDDKSQILSYEDRGVIANDGNPLLFFKFSNGKTNRYHPMWIKVKVDFVLDESYK